MPALFVHDLTVIDLSLLDPERGLLGESWLVDIELEGELDGQGMVLDFGAVRKITKQTIDRLFDHRLLLPSEYPGCRLEERGKRSRVRFRTLSGEAYTLEVPGDSLRSIDAGQVDADTLTRAIDRALRPLMPANVRRLELRLRSERIEGAWYRYSHGLKQHRGNCQRIAHGHRSRIHIFRNGQRDTQLEHQWAESWRDVYLGCRDDLRERFEEDGVEYCRFAYRAMQGDYELTLPRSRCRLLDRETTVENLACHIASTLRHEHPGTRFRVEAFEGVGKGAICGD
ncbi:MAG TPA: hypothetical protein ENK50_06685 [Sedimenticola sp.]|nr:hypothetical protein [Sedimenticola sp.]